jgi:hypothetical protein
VQHFVPLPREVVPAMAYDIGDRGQCRARTPWAWNQIGPLATDVLCKVDGVRPDAGLSDTPDEAVRPQAPNRGGRGL